MNKHLLAAATMSALSAAAVAQDVARVVSSTAVTQQVAVPRQACATYAAPGVPPQCSTQMVYESRTVGYNVLYEHAGKRYTVQLPQDPGATLRLQAGAVEVAAAPMPAPAPASMPRSAPPSGTRITSVEPVSNAPMIDLSNDPGLPPDTSMVAQPYPSPVQVTYAYPGYSAGYYPSGYGSYYGSPHFWGPVVSLGLVGGYYGGRHHFGGYWNEHGHGRGYGHRGRR
jgi:hypothetical protein